MKRTVLRSLIFFFLFIYGLFLARFDLSIMTDDLKSQHPPGYYDYRGVTHCHSSLYGSTTPAEDVIESAQQAGLDFLFFTDLNVFHPPAMRQGYHRNLLVFDASEYSYLDTHLLYYDFPPTHAPKNLGQAQFLFSDLLSREQREPGQGFLVLAHPFKGSENWQGSYPSGLDGVEVINLKSVWQNGWQESKISYLWSAFVYIFNSHLALLRLYSNPTSELALWDQLNQRRPTIGLVGNDTAERPLPGLGRWLRFPSYQESFEFTSNHILLRSELTGDPEQDQRKVLNALRNGQFYMSIDTLANPRGFLAHITDAGTSLPMGSQTHWRKGLILEILLPEKPTTPFEVVIYHNGRPVMTSNAKLTQLKITEPGVYRAVVRVIPTLPLPDGKKWIPWIYTNPFFIRP